MKHPALLLLLATVANLQGVVPLKTAAPVLLWSTALKTSPDADTSFTEQIDGSDLSKYLDGQTNNIPVVVFVQNELNVEQFTSNQALFVSNIFDDAKNNPMFFTNVKNTKSIYSRLAGDESNRVVYLPENSLAKNEDLIKSYVDLFNKNGSAIYVLTGNENDYLVQHQLHKRAAADDDKKKYEVVIVSNGTCLLLYAAQVELTFADKPLPLINAANPTATVTCGNAEGDTDKAERLDLQLHDNTEPESDKKPKYTITAEFAFGKAKTTKESPWVIKSIQVVAGEDKGTIYSSKRQIDVLADNSFSCGKLVVDLYTKDKDGKFESKKAASLTFRRFQVQPFANEGKFVESSDCSVWFTLPIWMSLIIILILLTILYSGVSALVSITTPDRFENPKNRPLVITNFDE